MSYQISTLYQWALRKITYEPLSTTTLRHALRAHLAHDPDGEQLTDEIIKRLIKTNIVNDARMAIAIANQHLDYGDRFIKTRLKREELGNQVIDKAIAQLPKEEIRAREFIKTLSHNHRSNSVHTQEGTCALLSQQGFTEKTCQQVSNDSINK